LTLIVAIPADDGVALGSDSQVTTGIVRSSGTKIFRLNEHTLWGASGELALIQRVAERIATLTTKDEPLPVLRDELAPIVKGVLEELLRVDFRTQFCVTDPNKLLELHPAHFLFAEYRDEPRILSIRTAGTAEWIEERFAATGVRDVFAYALLQKYQGAKFNCDRARLLTYKVIEEAIQVGAYGLGRPIDIWEMRSNGVRQLKEKEILALEDSVHLIRDREIEMLTGSADTNSAVADDPKRSTTASDRVPGEQRAALTPRSSVQ